MFSLAQEVSLVTMGRDPYTMRITASDSSQSLTDLIEVAYGADILWGTIRAVLLSAEVNPVRLSFGRSAAVGATPMGHILGVDKIIRLPSSAIIRQTHIINARVGATGTLMVTIERN